MKIDLVIPSLGIGGSERQLSGLALGLAAEGHDVGVLVLADATGPLADELERGAVQVDCLCRGAGSPGFLQAPDAVVRIANRWRHRRPDAVQAWLPAAQIVALPVARALRIPHRIMAVRSLSSPVSLGRLARQGLRLAARSATVVTGNARAVLEDPGWPLGRAPRAVIPNALALPASPAEPGRTPAHGVMVANLTPIKGHSVLLEALSRLPSPPAFSVVGSGELLDDLQTEVLRRGLGESVEFHTGITDPTSHLADAQFFVLSSPSEGLPNAVMEAMATGLPVVAFRVGGIPEIVEDGVSGILVNPGDVEGLTEAIGRVASDPAWRAAAGTAARAKMSEFSWDSMVQRNLDIMGA